MRPFSSTLTMKRSVFFSPNCLLNFRGMTTTLLLSVRYAFAVVTIVSTNFCTSILDKIYMVVTIRYDFMTQTTAKSELKDIILWFIGCHAQVQAPDGPVKIKQRDYQASYQEIKEHFESSYPKYRDGRRITITRRTLYRYIEELIKEGFVKRGDRGIYKLSKLGIKRWSLVNALAKGSSRLPIEKPIGTFFSFGPKEKGRTKYVDIIIRVADLDLIKIIEKAIAENKAPKNTNKLGWLISMIIVMHFQDIFSMMSKLSKGKEEVLSELIGKLPIYKKWLEPE